MTDTTTTPEMKVRAHAAASMIEQANDSDSYKAAYLEELARLRGSPVPGINDEVSA